jgi:GntR family transcriptional regulator
VYRLRTLFSLVGKTTAVNDAVLPAGLFPGLKKSDVTSKRNMTLYALYQTHYDVNVIAVSADVSADAAPADVAGLLSIGEGHPVLRIERKAYTYEGVPVELRTSWVNTADCKFHVDQGSTAPIG